MKTRSKANNNQYLKLHHDTWVYCRRVPKAIKHLYPDNSHITLSLKTSSVKVARLKRDKINSDIAAQIAGAFSAERIQFKSYLKEAEYYAEAFNDKHSCISYDDILPRNPVALAAYKQAVKGNTDHPFGYTLKEAFHSYQSRNEKVTAETISKVKSSVERFLYFIDQPDIALNKISKKEVVKFVQHLGQEYAHGTIVRYLSGLRTVWIHAYKLGEIEPKISPFCDHDLSMYRGEGSKQKQLFSAEQLKMIFNDVPQQLKPLVKLGLYTGARLSELCGAHEEVIEGRRCMVILKGKTASAARIIPLPNQVADVKIPLGLETKNAGRLFSNFKVNKITDDKTRTFHSLRVHYATAAQRAGVSEFDAAKVLGHKTGISMSYGHYAKEDVKRLEETSQRIADQIDIEWL